MNTITTNFSPKTRATPDPVQQLEALLGVSLDPEVRSYAQTLASELTEGQLVAWRSEDGDGPITRDAWSQLGALGAIGLTLPKELGGAGLSFADSLVLTSILAAREEGGFVLGANVQSEVACRWLADADPAIRDAFLPGLLAGELVACQCDTDPSAESPATIERDGGDLIVTGRKLYVVNGGTSDLCFVAAKYGTDSAIVLVEKSRVGVRVEKQWDKLGTRSIDSATVSFDAVRVPANHLVSRLGLRQLIRWNEIMSRLRLHIAVAATIMHESLLDGIVAHTVQRPFGGRKLANWPVNHHALTKAGSDLELMKAGVAAAARMVGTSPDAVAKIAQVKWFAVERACEMARLACDLEGGLGYMAESRSLRTYRTLRGFRMAGGSQTTMLTIANHTLANKAETEPFAQAGRGQ